jgi:hypothetical protein
VIYISTLTEIELFSHASMTEKEERRLETFLEAVQILPLTSQIARIASDLRRSHAGLKAFDSGIAAMALFAHSQLITPMYGISKVLMGCLFWLCEQSGMDESRKRYLIASALLEYINNEAGKPFALQRHSDVEDMQQLLNTEYADLAGVLAAKKAAGHRNLAGIIAVIKDNDEAPAT